jgi:hypothetical protein
MVNPYLIYTNLCDFVFLKNIIRGYNGVSDAWRNFSNGKTQIIKIGVKSLNGFSYKKMFPMNTPSETVMLLVLLRFDERSLPYLSGLLEVCVPNNRL